MLTTLPLVILTTMTGEHALKSAMKEDKPVNGATGDDVETEGTATAKPRARLGPTEVVVLADSDSEEDEERIPQGLAGEGREVTDDFLSDYPEDTDVSCSGTEWHYH